MKKCGFIIRVSTYRQALNKEGSLKNQLQRLRAHIEYKNQAKDEKWIEKELYMLEAVSGKDSFRSKQFSQLFKDIERGKINTIMCTALDRVCRSVKDFLSFFEFINKHGVEFVCLKQNYDTTSPHGRLFITLMMALAEFEREQTSERNKATTLARAERGLWNGGQILGYDLDSEKKGNLIPNEKEKVIINFAFNTYIKTGSLMMTAKMLNENGFMTKNYTSRRGIYHNSNDFSYSSVKNIITNYAYLGKKEINKKKKTLDQDKLQHFEKYRIVEGAWEAIVDESKFFEANRLLKENNKTKHNSAKKIKHSYILNGNFLFCSKCGTEMEGRSGTGRLGKRYYYYKCKNSNCGFKVPAMEIEKVIIGRLNEISKDDDILKSIIRNANLDLQKELPQLIQQKYSLEDELQKVKDFANGIFVKWNEVPSQSDNIFFKEKLEDLAKRREKVESGINEIDKMIQEIEQEELNEELIKIALSNFSDMFFRIKSYEQKQLIKLVINKVMVNETEIKIALYGQPSTEGLSDIYKTGIHSQTVNWLPG